MILSKSLQELDAYADELLSKSEKAEGLTPEEVSQENPEVNSAGESQSEENPEEDEKKEKEEEKPAVKKSEDVAPVGEKAAGEEDEEEKPAEEPSKEEMEKSIQGEMLDNPAIQKSVEASEFLQSIVSILSKSMADTTYETQLLQNATAESNEVLAKSLQASLMLNKSLGAQVEEIKGQNETLHKSMETLTENMASITSLLEEISHQPSGMRKSVSNIQAIDRDFKKSLDGTVNNPLETLSKSQILNTLNQELYSGNTLVTPTDIISYESGAPLRPELANLVRSKM